MNSFLAISFLYIFACLSIALAAPIQSNPPFPNVASVAPPAQTMERDIDYQKLAAIGAVVVTCPVTCPVVSCWYALDKGDCTKQPGDWPCKDTVLTER